ncbi:arsenite S-adenosylmethyltransferase [Actinoplanes capillaceus]|uniref:Arsenite methyltransferase n=1 Tax=Actinoplanes campanulatus TaxID=113559 RepID=A0ABQ3WSK3_9ACTN|nr:arsenite methyltransferase [Actinoplanes capillaceus]GID49151.1 arsenite S-adenosylmethyltransferase [Actinoplanes capillaceus]
MTEPVTISTGTDPCCGTTAAAEQAEACCDPAAKTEAVTTGATCCGPAASTEPAVGGCCGTATDTSGDGASIREQVRARYASAATRAAEGDRCGNEEFYDGEERGDLPEAALRASLGCGNPLRVADLNPGETVLDLGSGGGIDVLLSARRVGPTGTAHGLDMTDEMLELARRNAAEAGAVNVEFHKGHIEAIPLPDASIDVIISNCVINLSADKPAVFAEMHRVLRPGGRIGISDVVAEDHLTPQQRAVIGDWSACIAGALSRTEYIDGLTAAGFTDVSVEFTGAYAESMHAAIVRASRP